MKICQHFISWLALALVYRISQGFLNHNQKKIVVRKSKYIINVAVHDLRNNLTNAAYLLLIFCSQNENSDGVLHRLNL